MAYFHVYENGLDADHPFCKIGEGVPHADYFPFFRYVSNSSKGRQLITLPFSTQARLACETPYFIKPRARSSWASVSMVILTPVPTASRTYGTARSRRST